MIGRLLTIIAKEFIQYRRNPAMLRMIVLMPIMQMFIFGYAAVLDIKDINIAVLDKDKSSYSRELRENFISSNYFIVKYDVDRESEIVSLLDREKVFAGIIIPPDFSRNIKSGKTARVQVVIDGTNSSAAGVISNYSASTISSYSSKLLAEKGLDPSKMGSLSVEERYLYNPSLNNQYFFIPGILGMIVLVFGMPITAMAIVREKEQGTLEQIIVTPITSTELILGKVIPTTILIMISASGIILLSLLWFKLPLRGELWQLYLAICLFLLNSLGIGIFISTISNTQQQAILTSFFVNMPMILFSGFMFPVDNMPALFKRFADINAMRYFLECSRDIFLKGTSWEDLSHDLIAMGILGIIVFTASIVNFHKRID
ncbi:MAG: ABC transporter permease [Candidatus Eremiobacteraeota bacterium]|nr:ABC transporter permease [Candidatus Eremiobacteraeota bacterium]